MSAQKTQTSKRWWLWLPLLAAGAWLALFGDKSPAGDAAASAPVAAVPTAQPTAAAPATRAVPASDATLVLVPRHQLLATPEAPTLETATTRDLFSARNWKPPPPPSPPVVVAAPVAPPVPYAFLGKKLEAEIWEVYLSRGEQTFVARTGAMLEGEWHVDRIAPPSLELTYMPLGQALTLSIGETR